MGGSVCFPGSGFDFFFFFFGFFFFLCPLAPGSIYLFISAANQTWGCTNRWALRRARPHHVPHRVRRRPRTLAQALWAPCLLRRALENFVNKRADLRNEPKWLEQCGVGVVLVFEGKPFLTIAPINGPRPGHSCTFTPPLSTNFDTWLPCRPANSFPSRTRAK